jgi:NAD(P)-dependent dehydrogenase (short-subunit alcohol dehydrogenase family)
MSALKGKVSLVTGASRGIGRATALRLAREGAHVIAHYGRSEAAAKELAINVRASGGKISLVQADLTKTADVARLADAVRTEVKSLGGALHILVNNAGIAPFAPFTETTDKTLDEILAVNVKAPFVLTAKLQDLIPDGGRVIFLTTAVTKTYFPGIAAYSASKGAIDTLILHLAAELGPKGIRVTGVAPGAIETDMSAWLNSDEGKGQAHAIQALKRIGQPDDIANVIAFLSGPDGAWVTGHIVNASGGTKL